MAWDDVYAAPADGQPSSPAGPRISLPPAYAPSLSVTPGDNPPKSILETSFKSLPSTNNQTGNSGEWGVPRDEAPTRIREAAISGWQNAPPILTPKGEQLSSDYLGPLGTYVLNPLAKIGSGVIGAASAAGAGGMQTISELAGAAGAPPSLQRDINLAPIVTMQPEIQAGISRLMAPREVPPRAPPSADLPTAKATRDAWYNVVDNNAGAAIKPDYSNQGLDAAITKLQPKGPLSQGARNTGPLSDLKVSLNAARDQPVTLGDYADFDRDLTGQINEQTNNTTAGIMSNVQKGLRSHFENAGPDDVVGGQAGFDALNPARLAHTQVSKMEDINDLINQSRLMGLTGGNEAGTMRTRLRNYLDSDASGNLTPAEREAGERALSIGPIGATVKGVSQIASPIVGGLLGGVPGAIAAQTTREGLTGWQTALARGRVQGLLDVIGQRVPSPPPFPLP